ncbi:MAG: FAD-dependent oxidoreductase, partial [Myxococcales bacterium]|nr:FAD-dependent oxidoreductase [Myxococcales bacterium]
MAENYDLVVIGSGPAGEKGAAQAAYFGKRVAVVERQAEPGGAATNTGTLPSKTLRETALMLSGMRAREVYGLDLTPKDDVTVADFLRRKLQVVQAERQRIRHNLERHDVELVRGDARFLDANRVEVTPADGGKPWVLETEKVLIATGSSPRRPDVFHFEDPRIYDSDTILRLRGMPKRMVVIGAGV